MSLINIITKRDQREKTVQQKIQIILKDIWQVHKKINHLLLQKGKLSTSSMRRHAGQFLDNNVINIEITKNGIWKKPIQYQCMCWMFKNHSYYTALLFIEIHFIDKHICFCSLSTPHFTAVRQQLGSTICASHRTSITAAVKT